MKKHLIFIAVLFCSLFGIIGLSACATEEPVESTTYKISVTCGENGSYSLSPERESYEENTQVTLTVTPNENFEVETVTVNNQTVTLTNNTYSFAVVSDTNISISFREANTPVETYKISVSCGENGSYSLSPEQESYEKGTNVELTVTPSAGYVAAVTVNGTAVSLIGGKCSFEVTADMNVSITFNEEKYNVSVNCGQNGTYTISKRGSVNAGEEVTLTVTPYGGYEVDQVLLNGDPVELIDGKYVFTVSEDAAFEITFKVATYDITVNCGEGGSYTLSQEHDIAHNTEVTLTVTTDENYYSVESVLVNGRRVRLTDGVCSFRVTSDTTIEITLAQIAVKITVDCSEGGRYMINEKDPVAINSSVTLLVIPEDDYYIKQVLVDGKEVELTDGEYTFTALADMTIEITFVEQPGIFAGAYRGLWNPSIAAGVIGNSIKITAGTLTFGETLHDSVIENDGKYTFQETDEEGETSTYTVSFEEIYGEKYLLTLSFKNATSRETLETYYIKDGLDYYTYTAPEDSLWKTAIGGWKGDEDHGEINKMAPPIMVSKTGIMIGTSRAVILETAAESVSGVLADGIKYHMSWGRNQYWTGFEHMTLYNDDVQYWYKPGGGYEAVKVPQYAGLYTAKQGTMKTINIDADGNFRYQGRQYTLYLVAEEGNMHMYSFERDEEEYLIDFLEDATGRVTYLWLHDTSGSDEGEYFYTDDYASERGYELKISCGENGAVTVTPDPETEGDYKGRYKIGTIVTITVTANEGYVISSMWLGTLGSYRTWYDDAEGQTRYEFTVTLNNELMEWHGTSITLFVSFRADATATVSPQAVEVVQDAWFDRKQAEI